MNNNNEAVIEIKQLKKRFKGREKGKVRIVDAVSGIDLCITAGEIFGLLGPNGAGKTTAMRILCTLLVPTSGEAKIAGFDLLAEQEQIRKNIGYVGQKGGMEQVATGRENLMLQAQLHGMSKAEARAAVDAVIKRLQIEAFVDRKTKTYSGGQRRICDLAAGVLHNPKILFLDEPSTGLDPQSRARVWEELRRIHETGTTIFLTTHYLEEADAICDRVAIIDSGKVVALGRPSELKQKISGDVIHLELQNEETAKQARIVLAESLTPVEDPQIKENTLQVFVDRGDEALPRVMRILQGKNIAIKTVRLSRPSLDDVFLKLTGRTLREEVQQ